MWQLIFCQYFLFLKGFPHLFQKYIYLQSVKILAPKSGPTLWCQYYEYGCTRQLYVLLFILSKEIHVLHGLTKYENYIILCMYQTGHISRLADCIWHCFVTTINERWHEISNNVVCATSKALGQPAHMRSQTRAFASRLNFL